jgi:3',5'-cyclic AMP phosphodiesterase CpdA
MRRILASLLTAAVFFCAAPSVRVSAQAAAQSPAQSATGSRVAAPAPVNLTLPLKEGSVRFAVIGDTGTGTPKQYELGGVMVNYRRAFPFEFVLMMGDNLYNGESAQDYKKKFEDAYKTLLDDGVKFYATLGNHDESNQRFYAKFNMNGEEYYNFNKGSVSFYSLNSNYMDAKQLKWLEEKLASDKSEWKVVFFHHPPYSSGKKHGSSTGLREVVEPLFLKYGVNVVFAGHEHFYERIKPQKGIYYFISGAGGKLRDGNVREGSPLTAKGYDKDMSFMLIEVAGDEMHFQCINRLGETVDSGVIANQRAKAKAASASN